MREHDRSTQSKKGIRSSIKRKEVVKKKAMVYNNILYIFVTIYFKN